MSNATTAAPAQPIAKQNSNKDIKGSGNNPIGKIILYVILIAFTCVFLGPILFIFLNSFKATSDIYNLPFSLPLGSVFYGTANYMKGVDTVNFFSAITWSFVITITAVFIIVMLCAMTAYYITRVKSWWTSVLYYMFVFSMVIPFQMVMFPTSNMASLLHLNNPQGLVVLYLGFGAGLSVFMFAGFVKSIPIDIEEAATIDGCNPVQTYFRVVLPMLKPTAITVAILNTMWVWNDFLLPYLILSDENKTIPMAIYALQGSYGNKDMGALMAMLVLAIIPIIIFYIFMQKYIIEGVAAGAVKG